jgi:hypothetical protein
MSFRVPLLAGALFGVAAIAAAQAPLQLQISNGRVTLHAQNVPVRAILAEWSKVGGTRIMNGEGVAGAPLTLDLQGVPERQALDIILRGVSGYVLAARQPGTPSFDAATGRVLAGASIYDRIMILPTSVAPRNPPPAVAGGAPGIIRPVAPRQGDDPSANDDADAAQGNDGVPLGRPVPIPRPVVGGAPIAVPGNPPIAPPVAVVPDGEPQQQPPVVATPANPFGLPAGSSTRPGVIAPPPAAQPPRPPDQD